MARNVRRSPQRHIQPTTRAGTPTTSAWSGTSRVTTAPAPTNAYCADGVPADHGRVGADGRAAPHHRRPELALARDVAPRIDDVGEHHARAAEDVVLEHDALVDRHVVLDLDAVADDDVGADVHVLPERAAAADARARHDVAPMPDPRARPDHGPGVDHRARMGGKDGGLRGPRARATFTVWRIPRIGPRRRPARDSRCVGRRPGLPLRFGTTPRFAILRLPDPVDRRLHVSRSRAPSYSR